jgi:hypothetical protein
MNKVQNEYKKALDAWEINKAKLDRAEQVFIQENQIKNDDGSLVKSLIHIKNDEVFEKENEKFCNEYCLLCDTESEARYKLQKKENALINYALSIVPVSVANRLRQGLRIVTFGKELIDLTMQFNGKVPVKIRKMVSA